MAINVKAMYGVMRHCFRIIYAVAGVYYLFPTVTPLLLALCFLSTCWRIFAFHGGGHRYFAHKSYECPAWLCNIMAMSIMATEIGPIFYWILLHEYHHQHCDLGTDIHSPQYNGFWAVQFGLYGDNRLYDAIQNKVKESQTKLKSGYSSDLRWITAKLNILLFFGEVLFWIILSRQLGLRTFELHYWLCMLPRLYTGQAVAMTNSVGHWFGTRPYTGNNRPPFGSCMATNCWWGAILNGGECWHNNHHAFSRSARHGLLFWEIDTTWLAIRLLAYCGLVWNVIEVSDEVRLAPRDSDFRVPQKKYTMLYARDGKTI